MNNRKISIEIETLRAGQPRRYADSEYEYILTVDGMSEFEAKKYCTEILQPCKQTKQEWIEGKDSADVYFLGYYTFEKIGDNKYRYYMLRPFCD